MTTAALIRKDGMAKYAEGLTTNPTRSRFKLKDPRGFAEFTKHLSEHPDLGAANTMENYQGKRPSLYDFEDEVEEARRADADHLRRRGRSLPAAEPLPGSACMANAGLAMFAKTGHAVNIEEPDAFNRELWNFHCHGLEAGRWTGRPRLASPKAPGLDPVFFTVTAWLSGPWPRPKPGAVSMALRT